MYQEIVENQKNHYHIFYKIKTNGKRRKIIAPSEEYRQVLSDINKRLKLLNLFSIHELTYGWIDNVSRIDCVKHHVNQKYVMELDISDFFPGINEVQLRDLFKDSVDKIELEFNISFNDFIKLVTIENSLDKRILAQGFNTSPYLANGVRYNLDSKMYHFASANELNFSSYGDNIFISGECLPKSLLDDAKNIIRMEGFRVNEKKCKIRPYFQRQKILGIVVNKKINIPKQYICQLVDNIKNSTIINASIAGKINVLKLSENLNHYNYITKIAKEHYKND